MDDATSEAITALPWTRFLPLLEARIIEADPESAEARRVEAATRRYFGTTRVDEHGLKTLYARYDAGDITLFAAVADRIAQILGLQGDDDPIEVRRAKAFGILADPARALRLLAEASSGAYGDAGESVHDAPELRAPQPEVAEPDRAEPPVDLHATLQALQAARGRSLVPTATLYLHLTPGSPVARVEGIGPVLLSQVRDWLRHRNVTIRPVLDLAEQMPVDSYEVPARMRENILARWPFEAFPFGTLGSRTADFDHVVPYVSPDEGGPPGQTRPDNIVPLGRLHHRAKTHANWVLHQAAPSVVHWRSPTGHWFEVDRAGTRHLGKTEPPVGLELVLSRLLQTHAAS